MITTTTQVYSLPQKREPTTLAQRLRELADLLDGGTLTHADGQLLIERGEHGGRVRVTGDLLLAPSLRGR